MWNIRDRKGTKGNVTGKLTMENPRHLVSSRENCKGGRGDQGETIIKKDIYEIY